MEHAALKALIADAFTTKWSRDYDENTDRKMMFGSSHVPPITLIKEVLDRVGMIFLVHPALLTEQWAKNDLDPQMHILMDSGSKVQSFPKKITTLSNRKHLKLFLNVLSISIATNNIDFPSVNLTKTYDNTQYVLVDGEKYDLAKAARHNLGCFIDYYNDTWEEKKVEALLGVDLPENLPLTLRETFTKIAKFRSAAAVHGLSMDWPDRMNDRVSATHMKHPHQVFLYQNVYAPLTYTTIEEVKKVLFPGAEQQKNTWKKFFHVIPSNLRARDASCIGWNSREHIPNYKPYQPKKVSGKMNAVKKG